MFDKLYEAINKLVKVETEPAKRGDSIKPGVERSGTPGSDPLCDLCEPCASVLEFLRKMPATEAQRTLRIHRERKFI